MEQHRTEKRCGSKNYCGDVYAESRCGTAVLLGIAQRIERLSRSPDGMPHRNNFRFSPSILAAANRILSEWSIGSRNQARCSGDLELGPLADNLVDLGSAIFVRRSAKAGTQEFLSLFLGPSLRGDDQFCLPTGRYDRMASFGGIVMI